MAAGGQAGGPDPKKVPKTAFSDLNYGPNDGIPLMLLRFSLLPLWLFSMILMSCIEFYHDFITLKTFQTIKKIINLKIIK